MATKSILSWITPLCQKQVSLPCPLLSSTNLLSMCKEILCVVLQSQLTSKNFLSAKLHSHIEQVSQKLVDVHQQIEQSKAEIDESLSQNRLRSSTGVILERHQVLFDFLFGTGLGTNTSWRLNEIIEHFEEASNHSHFDGKTSVLIFRQSV